MSETKPEGDDYLNEAFVAEISESQLPLNAYILKLVGNYHHAKDILQETNLVLWKKRMDWDPETPFLKWAYRVAYFETKSYFRDQKREKVRLCFNDELLDLLSQDHPDEENNIEIKEALESCLQKIAPEKRTALLERYKGDHSVEELADRLGKTPNAFSQTLRRLRTNLSQCIQTQLSTSQ